MNRYEQAAYEKMLAHGGGHTGVVMAQEVERRDGIVAVETAMRMQEAYGGDIRRFFHWFDEMSGEPADDRWFHVRRGADFPADIPL